MRMPKLNAFFCCVLILFVITSVNASQGTPKVTGIFSSMKYIEEGEDVVGLEVLVTYADAGNSPTGSYYVVFQSAEGSTSIPVVARATISGKFIEFEIPKNDHGFDGVFRGEITKTSLRGTFAKNPQLKVVLRRGKSYWQ